VTVNVMVTSYSSFTLFDVVAEDALVGLSTENLDDESVQAYVYGAVPPETTAVTVPADCEPFARPG